MPCYNALPYLNEAIESILNQTYKNLEILCINDGSSDDTGEVLEKYAKKDKRIRVVHNEKNLKLIATLNKGIQLAKGSYIARMDADDVSLPNRIEEMITFLQINKVDLVSCKSRYISESGKLLSEIPVRCFDSDAITYSSYFFTPIGHAPLLAKRSLFEEFLYAENDQTLHVEDYELWTRMLESDKSILNYNKVLYHIRINQESVSRKYEEIQIRNFISCANKHQEWFLNRKIPYNVTAVSVNRMNKVSFKTMRQAISLINEITEKFIKSHQLNNQKLKEIKSISEMQKIDISIQLIKKGSLALKVFGVILFIQISLKNISNRRLIKYIKAKF